MSVVIDILNSAWLVVLTGSRDQKICSTSEGRPPPKNLVILNCYRHSIDIDQ